MLVPNIFYLCRSLMVVFMVLNDLSNDFAGINCFEEGCPAA